MFISEAEAKVVRLQRYSELRWIPEASMVEWLTIFMGKMDNGTPMKKEIFTDV